MLVESLHKEQDKSYKLLKDLHQHMQETKSLKQLCEDQRMEIEQLREVRHKMQEVQEESDRMRQEILRMTNYIAE